MVYWFCNSVLHVANLAPLQLAEFVQARLGCALCRVDPWLTAALTLTPLNQIHPPHPILSTHSTSPHSTSIPFQLPPSFPPLRPICSTGVLLPPQHPCPVPPSPQPWAPHARPASASTSPCGAAPWCTGPGRSGLRATGQHPPHPWTGSQVFMCTRVGTWCTRRVSTGIASPSCSGRPAAWITQGAGSWRRAAARCCAPCAGGSPTACCPRPATAPPRSRKQ